MKVNLQLLREVMIDIYSNKCQYCGQEFEKKILQIEHIIPQAKGGEDMIQKNKRLIELLTK